MDRKTKRLIARCIDDVADEDGWANLGDVGNLIINIDQTSIHVTMDVPSCHMLCNVYLK